MNALGGFLKPHTALADSEVAVPSGSIKLKYHPLMRVALLCYITFVLWCIKLPFLNAAAAFSAELIQCGAPVPSCFSMQERPSLSLGVWVSSCPTFHQVQGGCCKRFGRSGRICKGPGQSSETVLLTSWMSDLGPPPPLGQLTLQVSPIQIPPLDMQGGLPALQIVPPRVRF